MHEKHLSVKLRICPKNNEKKTEVSAHRLLTHQHFRQFYLAEIKKIFFFKNNMRKIDNIQLSKNDDCAVIRIITILLSLIVKKTVYDRVSRWR